MVTINAICLDYLGTFGWSGVNKGNAECDWSGPAGQWGVCAQEPVSGKEEYFNYSSIYIIFLL